jgi:hypothetical protein
MKKSKLEQPQLKKKVIQEPAIGTTKTDIRKEVGLTRSAVSRFSSREDIRELVRSETCNLLEVLPDAVENVKTLVRDMGQKPKQEFKDKELSYKASLRVLESVSILNSSSPSVQVINIVKENQNEVPEVIKRLFNEISQRIIQLCHY